MEGLVLYHDFVSPFCRLAFAAAVDAAAAAGVSLRLHPFELRPPTAPLTPDDADAVAAELEAARPLAAEWGVALSAPPGVPRTAKAHEAVAFAAGHGRGVEMAARIYEACWTRGSDIGRIDVLAGLGEGAGVDPQALHVALGLDACAAEVQTAQREAERAGVTAVPLLRHGERWLPGVLPAAEILAWLRDAS